MKNFRRFLALMLCVMMVITSMPFDVIAEGSGGASGGFTLPPEGEDPFEPDPIEPVTPALTPIQEKFYDLDYITAFMRPHASTQNQYISSADIGSVYEYRGFVTLEHQTIHEFTQQSKGSPLFTTYEDITVWVKAPEGIVLCDADGTPLTLATSGDHIGYYAIELGDRPVPESGTSVIDIQGRVFAYMEGNGYTESKTFNQALEDVIVEAHANVLKGLDDNEDFDFEDIPFSQDQMSYTTNFAITGNASGNWTVDKYKNVGTGSDAVIVDGDNLMLTFYIRVGAGTDNNVSNQDSDYVRFGLIDLDTMVLKDNIYPVKNKYGVDTWPNSVKAYVGDTEIPGAYDATEHFVAFDEDTLATIDASSKNVEFDDGSSLVKRGTIYKVVLSYTKDDFVYPVSTALADQLPFEFKDEVEFSYILRDLTSHVSEPDDESSEWYNVAGGGNVGEKTYIFVGENARTSVEYTTFYSSQMGFGTVGFDIYPLDENDDELVVDGETVMFHIDLADFNDGHGAVSTKDYTTTSVEGTALEALKSRVPEGKVKVIADFSGLNHDMVVPVNSDNTQELTSFETILDVEADDEDEATFNFYLRYTLGGIVNVSKEYHGLQGEVKISGLDGEDGLYANTTFTLTPTGTTTGSPVTITLDSNGSAVKPVKVGTYDVTETAPDGYVSYVGTITIVEGDGNRIANVGTKLVNYPSIANIVVGVYDTDAWVGGNVTKTKSSAAADSDSGLTFKIQKKAGDNWEDVGSAHTPDAEGVDVDRYDDNGNLITYRVMFIGTDDTEYVGNIVENSDSGMTDAVYSNEFTFDNVNDLIEGIDAYILNKIDITAKKVVHDMRATPADKSGWNVSLSSSDTSFTTLTGVTGIDGNYVFENLPKTDDNGDYVTYTVSETLTTEQQALWEVAIQNNGVVSASSGDAQEIEITNTSKVASLEIEKVDAANENTKLAHVTFKVSAVVDGATKYVAAAKVDGIRTFTDDADSAELFETDAAGMIRIDCVPSGYVYTAHEITPAANYYNSAENQVLNKGAVIPAYTTNNTQITNVKHPTLTIMKHVYDPETKALVAFKTASITGATATFKVYTKDDSGNFVALKDADNNEITITATNSATPSKSGTFQTAAIQLPAGGDYYIRETEVLSSKLILPTSEDTVAPSYSSYHNTHETGADGNIYFGPYTVQDNKNYNVDAHITDLINNQTINVMKKNTYTGNTLSTLTGTGIKYRLAVLVPDTDTVLSAFLTGAGWTSSYTDADFTAAAGAAPSGYTWMFSAEQTSKNSVTAPIRDKDGNKLEYWVIETKAPTGYYNKIDADGTEGHNVVEAVYDAASKQLLATLSDVPKSELKVDKFVVHAADRNNGTGVVPSFYQGGVPIELYSVDKTTGKLTWVAMQESKGNDGARFENLKLDFNNYNYLAVERDSQGFDYKYEVSSVDYSVSESPKFLDGTTVTVDANGRISSLDSVTNYKLFTEDDMADLTGTGVYSATTSFVNSNPSIRFRFNKFADENANGVKDDDEVGLELSKFYMYKIPKWVWDSTNGTEQEKAALLTADYQYTDKYVYETDENGQFSTIAYNYNDQSVYIFKEINAPLGYKTNPEPLVVVFDDYKSNKNGLYDCEAFANEPVSGGGSAFLRYLRVEVDKYADMDVDAEFTSADRPLAGVTFDMHLVDRDHNIIPYEKFERFFTTGVTPTAPSRGRSETFYITEGFIKGIADDGYDVDNIFTFYDANGEISYEDFAAHVADPTYDYSQLQAEFEMLLVEYTANTPESKALPPLTLPYATDYYITIRTGDPDNMVGSVTYNREWTVDNNNPILNAYGNHVYAELRKYTDAEKTTRWVPADSSDYVEYKFVAQQTVPEGEDPEFTKRIDSSNYNKSVLVELVPNIDYVVYEIHAPKGYDKPEMNYFFIEKKAMQIDATTGTIPVALVEVVNTPFFTFTIHKENSDGEPLANIQLNIRYSALNNANEPVYGPNDGETIATTLTTDENGDATITLPKYDYRAPRDGTTTGYSTATYTIQEIVNGAVSEEFQQYNGTKLTFSYKNTSPKQIRNPETGSIKLTKLGITDEARPLSGTDNPTLKFTLSYYPAGEGPMGTNTPDAFKTEPVNKTFTPVATDVTTDANGEYEFTNLSTGWYKLVETIPAGYMYAGGTYTVVFFYITPGDLINMKTLVGKDYRITTDNNDENIYIIRETISTEGADATMCGVTHDGTDLTITNTAKAYLNVEKIFAASDITNNTTVNAPATIKVRVDKGIAKDASGKVTKWDTSTIGTKTITITNRTGELGTDNLFELEPGDYRIVEMPGTANWIGTAVVQTAASTGVQKKLTLSGTANWIVSQFTITSADTKENPAKVTLTNFPKAMRIDALKVDGGFEPVDGAVFVVYEKVSGTTKYWSTSNTWVTSLSSAKTFTTADGGKLIIDFVADPANMSLDTASGKLNGTYYLKETQAPEGLTLIADMPVTMYAGEVKELKGTDQIVDANGLTVKFTLIGHTKENAAKHNPQDVIPGVTFELYKIGVNGAATKVNITDSVSHANTDANGEGVYYFLPELKEGEKYVLIQKTEQAPGYVNTDTYFDTDMGKTTLTVSGTAYEGVEVFNYESQKVSSLADVKVYNMPYSYILILKYDYDDPTNTVPEGITFNGTLIASDYATSATYTPPATTKAVLTGVDAVTAQALTEGYTFMNGVFLGDDGTKYSYTFDKVLPGTYTVSEVKGDTQTSVYLYVPNANEDDPWNPVHTGVTVGNDGDVAIEVFANVPVPGSNNVGITKIVSATDGNGANGALANIQETKANGDWQNITYKMSDFAPTPVDGVAQPYVKYPMSELSILDSGLTFKAGTKSVSNVESYVTAVKVGKANYVGAAVNSMKVAIYGVNGTEATRLTIVDVANADSDYYTFPAHTYKSFKLVYNVNSSGEPQPLNAKFKAEPVYAKFDMLQGSDANIAQATKATNKASVTMGYNIGVTDGTSTITRESTADVDIAAAVDLPDGKVLKSVSVAGNAYITGPNTNSAVEIKGGDSVSYKIVFTNEDDELVIPNAFIADVLPKCIDIDTAASTPFCTVTAYTDYANGVEDINIPIGDTVYVKEDHYVYVLTAGDLQPGGSLVMTIKGTVNTAAALDEFGTATGIKNIGYAGSATILPKSTANKRGAAFAVNGMPAPVTVPIADLAEYAATSSELNHKLWNENAITIIKEVAGTLTGSDNYMSGAANVAVTESQGTVYYRVTVTSKNYVGSGMMRITDMLPFVGDKELSGGSRNSGFEVTTPENFHVTVGGSTAGFDVTYTSSQTIADYRNALNTGSFASGISCGASDAKGWMIVVNKEIQENESVVVTFTCKAPSAIVKNGDIVTQNNLFKRAVNTASALVADSGIAGANPITYNSNPAYVSIVPQQKAAVGNRIWIDENENGIQDDGEPDFTLASGIQLRTFVGSELKSTASAVKSLSSGEYEFTGLTTATPVSDSDSVYYDNGNIKNSQLSGYTRTAYQLVVTGLPAGYFVTSQYAGNSGAPTNFGVKYDDSGFLIYDTDYSDGRDVDNDFAADETGKYVTRRFYLPIKSSTFPNVQVGGTVPEAVYDNFDMGVIRTRDLQITKTGANNAPVANAVFTIYGPYWAEPGDSDPADDAPVVGTITTNENGIATFTSTADSHLSYYAYYIVVETSAEVPYNTKTMLADSFKSTYDTSTNAGNANLPADGDTFILSPATKAQNLRIEKVAAANEYTASGSVEIPAAKKLTGADIEKAPFNDKFAFELTADVYDSISDFSAKKTLTNVGKDILDDTDAVLINYAIDEWMGSDDDDKYEFVYTLTEVAVDEDAIVIDPAVYTITVTVTDKTADGALEVAKVIKKDDTVVDKIEFNNTFETGDLVISKTVDGEQLDPNGDEFEYTVTLTAQTDDMGLLIYDNDFTVAIKNGTATSSISVHVDKTKHNFTLTLKHGDVATISDLPVGTAVSVTESDCSAMGYTEAQINDETSTTRTATGTINDSATEPLTFAYTNVRDTGKLSVNKTLAGNATDSNKEFSVTVTLTHTSVAVAGSYPLTDGGTIEFTAVDGTDGKQATATFNLKGGETKIIENILAGTTYGVEEASYTIDGYVTIYEDESGTIVKDETAECVITNTRNEGDLTVRKLVAGTAGEVDREFEFTITLTSTTAVVAGTYKTEAGSAIESVTFADPEGDEGDGKTATSTIKLKKDDYVKILGILDGTVYTVSENEDLYKTYGYSTEKTGASGNIDFEATEPVTAEFTNTRNKGSFELTKTVIGKSPINSYTFTVTLTYPDCIDLTQTENLPTIKGSTAGTVNGQVVTISQAIQAGAANKLVIENILVGTEYIVTEEDYSEYGFQTPVFNPSFASGAQTITVEAAKAEVSCTNQRDSAGLTISKTVAGTGIATDPNREFTFVITLEHATALVDKTYTTEEGTTAAIGAVAFTATDGVGHNATATITLKGGEQVIIGDIVSGTKYTVKEVDEASSNYAAYGYVTTKTGDIGTIPGTAAFTNNRDTGSLNVTKAMAEGSVENANQKADGYEVTVVITYDSKIDVTADVNKPKVTGVTPTVDATKHTITIVKKIKNGETLSITNILKNATYVISEENLSKYGYKVLSASKSTKVENVTEAYTYTLTNERNVGELDVTKAVEGPENSALNGQYEMTIALTYPTGVSTDEADGNWPTVSGAASGTTPVTSVVDGKVQVVAKIAVGDKLQLTNIPAGATYEVFEADYTGYGYAAASYDNAKAGTITAGGTAETAVTNVRELGKLTVAKAMTEGSVENETLADNGYRVTVEFTYANNIDVTSTDNKPVAEGATITPDSTNHKITVSRLVKNGDTLAITNILKGASYVISEADYSKYGYKVLSASQSVTVTNVTNDYTYTYTLTNERKVGELDVSKTVTGTANTALNDQYEMTIVLTYPTGVSTAEADGNWPTVSGAAEGTTPVTSVVDGNVQVVAMVAAGGTLKLTNIPAGATYEVTEADYTGYGYAAASYDSVKTGSITAGSSNAAKTTVTNDRKVGALDVKKTVVGAESVTLGGKYEMTIVLTYPTGVSVAETYGNWPTVSGAADDTTSFTPNTDANTLTVVAKVAKDGTLSLTGIPAGVNYGVTEEDYTGFGYEAAAYDDKQSDVIAANKTAETTVTNVRTLGGVNVTKAITDATTENAVQVAAGYKVTVVFTYDSSVDLTKSDNVPTATVGDEKVTDIVADNAAHTVTVKEFIKSGETLEIANVLKGTTYVVKEDDYTGYNYKKLDDQEGKIEDTTKPYEHTFTNERLVGELDITKAVTGVENSKLEGKYEMTIVLTYPDTLSIKEADGNRPAISGYVEGTTPSVTANGTKLTIVADIAKDGTLKLEGIPAGVTYTVAEKDYTDVGYKAAAYDDFKEETIVANKTLTTTITNVRELGSLNVTKAITDDTTENAVQLDEGYELTIVFTYDDKVDVTDTDNKPVAEGATITPDKDACTITVVKKIKSNETLEITNILKGTSYVISEADYTKYGYAVLDNQIGEIIATDKPYENTFTNERLVGSVEISKVLEGTGTETIADLEFEFTAVITVPEQYSLEEAFANIPTADHNATVTADTTAHTVTVIGSIKGGEKLTIDGILVGSEYTVTEANYMANGVLVTKADANEYDTREDGVVLKIDDSSVEEPEVYEHTFTNVRNSYPLTVTKVIDGNATDPEKEFTFTVTLTRSDLTPIFGTYTTVHTTANGDEDGTLEFTADTGDENVVTVPFTLKGGESLTIEDILADTEYMVHEDDYQIDGYLTDRNDVEGTIDAEDIEEIITNSRNLGTLSLTKRLGGNAPEYGRKFSFTITLSRTDALPIAVTYETMIGETAGTLTFTDNGDGTAIAKVDLRGNETLLIKDVYADTVYKVTEQSYAQDGYTTKSEGETGSILVGGETPVVFTNSRSAGQLTITKTIEAIGMGIPTDREFSFVVKLVRADGRAYNDDLPYEKSDGSKGNVTVSDGTVTVTLKHGESITIKDILNGVTYTVTEDPYTDCTVTYSGEVGTISAKEPAQADVKNTIIQLYTDLTIVKKWSGDEAWPEKRPDSIKAVVSTQNGEVGVYELDKANGWTVKLEKLPRYTDDGETLIYGVVEDEVPADYIVSYKADGHTVTITNTYAVFGDEDVPLGAGFNMNEGYCFN